MGKRTTNHDFYKPTKDEEGWERKKNGDWDDVDVGLIVKDTKQNRPADPPADTWFLAVDEPTLYHYDGSAWQSIAGRAHHDPLGTVTTLSIAADESLTVPAGAHQQLMLGPNEQVQIDGQLTVEGSGIVSKY